MAKRGEYIEVHGQKFYVNFFFEKGEDPVPYNGDGSGYPGSGHELQIISVISDTGDDITEFLNAKKSEMELVEAEVLSIVLSEC